MGGRGFDSRGRTKTRGLEITVRNEGTAFALQMARSSRGSDDHVKWRSRQNEYFRGKYIDKCILNCISAGKPNEKLIRLSLRSSSLHVNSPFPRGGGGGGGGGGYSLIRA